MADKTLAGPATARAGVSEKAYADAHGVEEARGAYVGHSTREEDSEIIVEGAVWASI